MWMNGRRLKRTIPVVIEELAPALFYVDKVCSHIQGWTVGPPGYLWVIPRSPGDSRDGLRAHVMADLTFIPTYFTPCKLVAAFHVTVEIGLPQMMRNPAYYIETRIRLWSAAPSTLWTWVLWKGCLEATDNNKQFSVNEMKNVQSIKPSIALHANLYYH